VSDAKRGSSQDPAASRVVIYLTELAKQGGETKLIWNNRSEQRTDTGEGLVTHTPCSIASCGGGSRHVSTRTGCIGAREGDHERREGMGGE
jgi:hypothetical protein